MFGSHSFGTVQHTREVCLSAVGALVISALIQGILIKFTEERAAWCHNRAGLVQTLTLESLNCVLLDHGLEVLIFFQVLREVRHSVVHVNRRAAAWAVQEIELYADSAPFVLKHLHEAFRVENVPASKRDAGRLR